MSQIDVTKTLRPIQAVIILFTYDLEYCCEDNCSPMYTIEALVENFLLYIVSHFGIFLTYLGFKGPVLPLPAGVAAFPLLPLQTGPHTAERGGEGEEEDGEEREEREEG